MTTSPTEDDRLVWRIGSDVAVVVDEKRGEERVHLLALDHTSTQQVPVVLTGTGCYLWALLDQRPCSVAVLVERAVADFPGVSVEDVRADVVGFVVGLRERGILVPDTEPPGPTPGA